MISLMTRILGEKEEWRAMGARANTLPRDYRTVYVFGLFETSAAHGRSAGHLARWRGGQDTRRIGQC
jgi:hypothetical protein